MAYWTSIEIFNGPFTARQWADANNDILVETAVRDGAIDWELNKTAWGVVFEVAFATEADWIAFRRNEIVHNTLQSAPDPFGGVLIYRGRSLDGGSLTTRKPKPRRGSGANALSLPSAIPSITEPLSAFFSNMPVDQRPLTLTR